MNTIVIALRATAVTLVLTGLLYPLGMTGAAQVLFPGSANGSLVKDQTGKVIGSRLIGQPFSNPGYFQGRPSAAGGGYDGTSSSGSNFGPTSAKLRDRVKADVDRLLKENPSASGLIPAELVMASGSGLDPHLSPEGARWQVPRVAKARNVAPERIAATLEELVEGRDLGFFGEPTVNVLLLNVALDQKFGKPAAAVKEPTPTQAVAAPPQ